MLTFIGSGISLFIKKMAHLNEKVKDQITWSRELLPTLEEWTFKFEIVTNASIHSELLDSAQRTLLLLLQITSFLHLFEILFLDENEGDNWAKERSQLSLRHSEACERMPNSKTYQETGGVAHQRWWVIYHRCRPKWLERYGQNWF